jgi:hypothetical protein
MVAAAMIATAVLAGCAAPPAVESVEPPPSISVWIVGDSLASGTAYAMVPRPHQVVSGGAAFTEYAPSLIIDNTEAYIAQHGAPETMLVIGGVGDVQMADAPEIIAGMEQFESAMQAHGIRLIWVAEPGFTFVNELVPLANWMLTHPDSIDCRFHKGWSIDGVHPVNYSAFGGCVSNAVAALGVTFE